MKRHNQTKVQRATTGNGQEGADSGSTSTKTGPTTSWQTIMQKTWKMLRYAWLFPAGVLMVAGVIKLVSPGSMTDLFEPFPPDNPVAIVFLIGLLELSAVVLFLIPATRPLGFLLLTSFIGGIIATETLRGGIFPVFPIVLQCALWAGYLSGSDQPGRFEPGFRVQGIRLAFIGTISKNARKHSDH